MKSTLTLLITLALLSFFTGFAQEHQHHDAQTKKSQEQTKETYSCPMHPEVVSDKPGKCPKCGMKLEKQVNKGESSPSSMMGKPTFEKSVEGINVQVWLITQEEHKAKMKEHMGEQKDTSEMKGMDHNAMHGKGMTGMMHGKKEESKDAKDHHMPVPSAMGEEMSEGLLSEKHDGKEMNKETMGAMMAGTHHVMVMATDETTKKAVDSADVKVAVTSPSSKASTVELKSMMNHFGGGLALDEKGEYTLDVRVSSNEKIRTASFKYDVK